MKRTGAGASLVLAAALILARPSAGSLAAGSGGGATVTPVVELLTLHSPALGGPTHVVVILPYNYRTTRRRYPVLYLLSGYLAGYGQWVTGPGLGRLVQGLPLIVVLSDAFTGWFTNPISGIGPRWEDYDIHELIPYIDTHFRTVARRAGRAIAGLSMGGFGAFEYAARHPDLFAFAGSFSGSLNLSRMEKVPLPYQGLSNFGNPGTAGLYWDGHNPVDLASNLRGVRLYLACGNGWPGPLDGTRRDFDYVEGVSHTMMMDMVDALRRARVPATVDDYGPGTHSPPYWLRDLRRALPLMLATFAHPLARPRPWSYRTTDDRFLVWGYHGVRTGAPPDWTMLWDVSRTGLTVAGTGLLTLTTARLYRPGAAYVIMDGTAHWTARAGAAGRLRLRVALSGDERPLQLTIVCASRCTARSQRPGQG